MIWFFDHAAQAMLLAASMAWSVLWSLVLGFVLSGLIQSLVSPERLKNLLGDDGPRALALATLFGAASSSCSYASAAISRSLFKRGAGFAASLAFLLASTNLVVELGLVLFLLLGWQFTLAEWLGGVVMVVIMAVLVRLTCPHPMVEEARVFTEAGGHDHAAKPVAGETFWAKLRNPELLIRMAQSFVMDVSMLWKDVLAGFLIAGVLGAFVPAWWWTTLFLKGAPGWLQVPADAAIGPLIAVFSFVCSIGNVPLAAVLWGSGIGFGGVLSFLYADLIVLPLLDVYRRTYGWKMAAYIAGVFYITMVLSGLVMEFCFSAAGLVPPRVAAHAENMHFAFDVTFFLNLLSVAVAVALLVAARRHPARAAKVCPHHGHAM